MSSQETYAFIDASNLFYGGEKSLGWRIDYKKLIDYLKDKYQVSKVFYFGGVEIHKFYFDYQQHDSVDLQALERYILNLLQNKAKELNEAELELIARHLQRIRFYLKLQEFGYLLYLKPVKLYMQDDGITKRKANCDVDMTFHLMKEKDNYSGIVVLSGDGDFLPVLKYLKEQGKKVTILSRGARTAKEIKQFAGSDFRDFVRLEHALRFNSR